jgi:beta-phosphoglucomutase-like phosphatase (HAD superfamily)
MPQSLPANFRQLSRQRRFEPWRFSAADVAHGKPAPDLFLRAAAKPA